MDNRTNILSQALSLFAARGYEGVGVQEIVDAANITKPTLYHYFGSKEGLLTELLGSHFTPFLKDLQEADPISGRFANDPGPGDGDVLPVRPG